MWLHRDISVRDADNQSRASAVQHVSWRRLGNTALQVVVDPDCVVCYRRRIYTGGQVVLMAPDDAMEFLDAGLVELIATVAQRALGQVARKLGYRHADALLRGVVSYGARASFNLVPPDQMQSLLANCRRALAEAV